MTIENLKDQLLNKIQNKKKTEYSQFWKNAINVLH